MTTTSQQRKIWPWIISVAVLVVLLAGAAVALLGSSTVTMRGQVDGRSSEYLSVFASNGFYPTGATGECTGNGDFGDVRQGAVVSVYDTDGTLVGTGQLQAGTGVEGHCTFAFEIPEVPAADLYQVEVAQRGKLPYTADEVEQGIRMDIGS